MATTLLVSADVLPAPRPAADAPPPPARRTRPAEQYWDVFEACWRRGPAGPRRQG
jgi:hypothetical protein